MHLDSDPDKRHVSLECGDSIFWYRQDGTVQFCRGGTRFKASDGDDKFIVIPQNFAAFFSLACMVAELHGFRAELRQDTARYVEYQFM